MAEVVGVGLRSRLTGFVTAATGASGRLLPTSGLREDGLGFIDERREAGGAGGSRLQERELQGVFMVSGVVCVRQDVQRRGEGVAAEDQGLGGGGVVGRRLDHQVLSLGAGLEQLWTETSRGVFPVSVDHRTTGVTRPGLSRGATGIIRRGGEGIGDTA